jgi:uncharacterized GH25 family protein
MKKQIIAASVVTLSLVASVFAHDLFLKPDNFFARVKSKVVISVLNGSFQESEGAVNFARLNDVSVIAPDGKVSHPVEADFTKNETTSFLNLEPQTEGTYVVGLSTKTREIDLKAKDFNDYLDHDGIPDTLSERKREKTLEKDVRERYSKHVKTLLQVGDKRTDNFKLTLGYPVEIVPQTNPYSLKAGDTFDFLCLMDGKPLVNQFVMTGYETAGGKMVKGKNVRTDKKGMAKIKIGAAGKWYVRFIQMTKTKEANLDYESKWATLTFAVK